jgi:alpha-tubulin suppressor-like RCC1 family protein
METASTRRRSTLGIREALMRGTTAWVFGTMAAATVSALVLGCADGLTGVKAQLSVSVTPDSVRLASIGEQVQLGAAVDVTSGTAPSPVWLTRNVDVAAVGDDGRVRAIANGETWVVALADANGVKASDSTRVIVSQVPTDVRLETTIDTLTWFGQTTHLAAVATDALGHDVVGATFAWSSSDSTMARVDSSGVVTALANGNAMISVAAGPAIAQIQLAVAQQVATVAVTPPTPSINVGATQQFAASAKDAGGTTVSGVKFLWVSANANVAIIDTTGLAQGTGVGTVTITAVGRGEPGNAVLSVGSAPTAPTQLAFTVQPSTSAAGQSLSPAVEVEIRDAGGNRVTSARNAVTIAIGTNPASGTLAGTKTVTAINGIASFSGLWIDKVGAGYKLAASATSLTGVNSATFNITPGTPTKLTFSQQPTNAEGNVAIAPAVAVTISDAFNNVVTTANNPVSVDFGVNVWKFVAGTGATLLGTKTVAAVNGVATFSTLRADLPGNGYTLVANANGLTGATTNPFAINLTVQSVRAGKGGTHTCALTSGGTYCWGYGGNGQLGDGTGTFTGTNSVPRLVSGGLTFTQVTTGSNHSCGITAAGAAYCWGYNGYGQLGNNSTGNTDVAVAVSGGLTFTSISAGGYHTCGVVGTAIYCWGYDGYGQLGDDANLTDKHVPTLVAGGLSWASVSPGFYQTCALTTGGSAYCWGRDAYGQLGNDVNLTNQPTPVVVAGGKTWVSISSAYYQTCGVDAAGAGFCWGRNGNGMLGADTALYARNSNQPTPVPVFGGLSFSTIGTGWGHSCGLTTTGSAYCWGANYEGELGDGTTVQDNPLRVAVAGGLTFDALSIGGYHTCGRVGSAVWCWGANWDGELGNGSVANKNQPVQIVQ